MSEWQPIETAPKDGTRVLVCIIPPAHCVEPRVAFWTEWTMDGWFIPSQSDSLSGGSFYHPDPTHWMPLPEPPK